MKTRLFFQIGLCAVVLCGCATHKDYALQRNKEIIRRYFERWANHGLFRLADGKIQEITVNMDRLGQAQQLGWLPAPAKLTRHELL